MLKQTRMDTVRKTISLPEGGEMPAVGMGTWTAWCLLGKPEEVEAATKSAIDLGFRHIDCAWVYGTEENVGNALKAKIEDGTVTRDEMFITTKLWDTHHNPAMIRNALEDSLRNLKTPYVDMYLVHWPTSLQDCDLRHNVDTVIPKDKDGNTLLNRHNHVDIWKAMEECKRDGLAKHIGLSNFNSKQITNILDSCTIKPANIQIEITPYHSNKKLLEFCKERGLVVTAYAPFTNPARPWRNEGEPSPFDEPLLKEIAAAKGKSIAQVVLRYHIQNGVAVIPKSVTPSRLKENRNVFDFELSAAEMTKIASLNRDLRVYKEPIVLDHADYPFNEPF